MDLNWIQRHFFTVHYRFVTDTCMLPQHYSWCAAWAPLKPHHYPADRPAEAAGSRWARCFCRASAGHTWLSLGHLFAALPRTSRGHLRDEIKLRVQISLSTFCITYYYHLRVRSACSPTQQFRLHLPFCSHYKALLISSYTNVIIFFTNLSYMMKSVSCPRIPMLPWQQA